MQEFTLFWDKGQRQVIQGFDFDDACTAAGYPGAMPDLAFYADGDVQSWSWSADQRKWLRTAPLY